MSVAVWIVLLLVGAGLFLTYIAWLFFGKPERKWWPSLLLLGMAPMFMGAIYIPYIYPHHYSGTMAVTSWHNTTVIEMKFFGLITLFLFYWVMKKMKEKKGFYPVWALFVVFLFLTVGFKTNFYISFCPLAGIILLIGFFKSIKEKQWTYTQHYFVTGVSILAVLPVLFYQGSVLFTNDAEVSDTGNQIIISFGTVFLHNTSNVALKIILSLLPFISVLIYSVYKKRITKEWLFLIVLFCIDVLIQLIFAESGSRMYHGNFGWGRHLSLYILNFVSLIQYCQYMREWKSGVKQNAIDKTALICCTLILLASIISGCLYFYKITWGGMSYGI